MKNCPLCNTPPEVDEYGIVTCDNDECDLWRLVVRAEHWNNRPIEQQLIDALLAARGIIEEGSADLEAALLQPNKVIGQIDAVLQSITGDNQ